MEENGSLMPFQPQGSDPLSTFLYILFLPLFIIRDIVQSLPRPQLPISPPTLPFAGGSYTNEETWEWVDYKGRERKIVVHRNARES